MSRKMLRHNNLLWINIEQPTTDDINYLKEQYAFHPLALEDCLSKLERPKIDEYTDHLFIVLHFPIFNRERRLNRPDEVDIFIGQDYLVPVHDGPLQPLTKFYAKCLQSVQMRDCYMRHNPSLLLHAIVDRLVDYLFPLLNKINQRITQIEEDIFNALQSQSLRLLYPLWDDGYDLNSDAAFFRYRRWL